ncbi:MAG: phospholipase [Deltaproteobacteria bacterium]|nr:phospholipase [Deltaproteobacteria bacterium]
MSDTSDRADLSEVPTSTLERLRDALAQRRVSTPITRAGLLAFGIKHQLEALEAALTGHSALACLSVLDVTLAERAAAARPSPELVWTGPERTNAHARDTAVVLRALFESARHQVILAGFSFERGSHVLQPLHETMQARNLDVRMFVHIEQAQKPLDDPHAYGEAQIAAFLQSAWPFGNPRPRVYYDQRAISPGPPWSSLHAKCVVVDGERAFVTSANFSLRAQEHNIEAGVLLHDAAFARHLAQQWMGLIDSGWVREGCAVVMGARTPRSG